MEKYYYIIVDRLEKEIRLVEVGKDGCHARIMSQIRSLYGLNKETAYNIDKRFALCFNSQNDYIEYNNVYKYARKFKVTEKISL